MHLLLTSSTDHCVGLSHFWNGLPKATVRNLNDMNPIKWIFIKSVYDISVEHEGLYRANAAPIPIMRYRDFGVWNLGEIRNVHSRQQTVDTCSSKYWLIIWDGCKSPYRRLSDVTKRHIRSKNACVGWRWVCQNSVWRCSWIPLNFIKGGRCIGRALTTGVFLGSELGSQRIAAFLDILVEHQWHDLPRRSTKDKAPHQHYYS